MMYYGMMVRLTNADPMLINARKNTKTPAMKVIKLSSFSALSRHFRETKTQIVAIQRKYTKAMIEIISGMIMII